MKFAREREVFQANYKEKFLPLLGLKGEEEGAGTQRGELHGRRGLPHRSWGL